MYNSFQLLYQVRKNVNNDGASSLNFLRGPLSIETKKKNEATKTQKQHTVLLLLLIQKPKQHNDK